MKPNSYRDQEIRCCQACRWGHWVRGTMALCCGFGEELEEDSPYELCIDFEGYVDTDNFEKWVNERRVDEHAVCDEYDSDLPSSPVPTP